MRKPSAQAWRLPPPKKRSAAFPSKPSPAKLAYTSGQTLDLNGLSVQVSYSDNTSKTIGWDANKLTADPAQGTVLTVTGHSGKTVTISYGGKTAKTDALTVGKAEPGGSFHHRQAHYRLQRGTPLP